MEEKGRRDTRLGRSLAKGDVVAIMMNVEKVSFFRYVIIIGKLFSFTILNLSI